MGAFADHSLRALRFTWAFGRVVWVCDPVCYGTAEAVLLSKTGLNRSGLLRGGSVALRKPMSQRRDMGHPVLRDNEPTRATRQAQGRLCAPRTQFGG
jgi:hypothetical protein